MPGGKAPWPNNFRPDPGNFGDLLTSIAVALAYAGPDLVGTATTDIYLPVPRSRTLFVCAANMTGAVAAAGSGAISAQLFKNSTALTATYDLTAATSGNSVDVPITAADVDCKVVPGDVLKWSVVAAGTITTSPDLKAVVELAVVK